MIFRVFFLVLLAFLPAISAQDIEHVVLAVDGSKKLSETDPNYICATLDWWPANKCDYGHCPWGLTSVLNLNITNQILLKAIKAFDSLRIRIGGSLEDKVLYGVGLKTPCKQFSKMEGGMFGFSHGCLHMDRWDDLNHVFKETGVLVTFGLNALNGRQKSIDTLWKGPWDSTNARDFINYTVSKGYIVDSWELGNELCGTGVGARVHPGQYGMDIIKLKVIIEELYRKSPLKPALVAPGGFFDHEWFVKFLSTSGPGIVNAVSHHIYNLGPGNDPELIKNILDPHVLSQISGTFRDVEAIVEEYGSWASPWVGESGGAYNSGGRLVSDTFVNSFWYLDQLGMASLFKTKVYCRQTLIGGNYGLLNTTTYAPNPDYFSALLWHRLMGPGVLSVGTNGSTSLRCYAHCSKRRGGVTLLLLNFNNHTSYGIHVVNVNMQSNLQDHKHESHESLVGKFSRKALFFGGKLRDEELKREEYHLTPKDGHLQSQTMLLNGVPLDLTENGDIPSLIPVLRNIDSPIVITPLSIAFVVLPEVGAKACL